MTNYYIIFISNLVDTFSRALAGKEFDFTFSTSESSLSDSTISKDDFLLVSVDDKVYYQFKVIDRTEEEIRLKKIFEIEKSINYNIDEEGFIQEITEQEFNTIRHHLFSEFNTENSETENNVNLENLKEDFADWIIKLDGSKHNYFKDSFNSDKVKLIDALSEYEDVYNEEFRSLIFSLPTDNVEESVKTLDKNLYQEDGEFFEFSKKKSTHMPRAILGRSNYLKFLKDRIENPEINSKFEIENIKAKFADWLFQQGKYHRVYKNDKSILIEKLSDYENAYENDFGIAIFDFTKHSIETIIGELKSNIIDESGQIGDLNKKTVGNGSVKAILGPNNYIKFLKELLKQQKVSSENLKIFGSQIDFDVKSFQVDCKNAGLVYTNQLITRFVSSLLTKPFVILTGLSGSGKTKLAQAYVQWICQEESQYRIIPVGADWTNREPLLGYPNALKPEEYVKPDSGVIDLIIQANSNPELPHFLILDEMNLSHVERYFADFLSVMESNEEIPLYAEGTVDNVVPSKLKVPANLFIIGTVNIDETTNMFSPKVLDRANTIEFRINNNEMKGFLGSVNDLNMKALFGKGIYMSQNFIDLSNNKSFTTKDRDEINKTLLKFFGELQKTGAEFGYRSATEILRLINQLDALDNKITTSEKIDIAIMQKLLPKLHGSRRKLSPILETLGSFCLTEDSKVVKDVFDKDDFDYSNDKVLYPLSLEKIARMYKGAIDNGFASYAEA